MEPVSWRMFRRLMVSGGEPARFPAEVGAEIYLSIPTTSTARCVPPQTAPEPTTAARRRLGLQRCGRRAQAPRHSDHDGAVRARALEAGDQRLCSLFGTCGLRYRRPRRAPMDPWMIACFPAAGARPRADPARRERRCTGRRRLPRRCTALAERLPEGRRGSSVAKPRSTRPARRASPPAAGRRVATSASCAC